MKEMNMSEIEQVNGGWSISDHTTLQVGLLGTGAALMIAGFSLTPLGAAVLVQASLLPFR